MHTCILPIDPIPSFRCLEHIARIVSHLLKVACMSAVQDKGGTMFFQGPHNVLLVGCVFSNSTARVSTYVLYHIAAIWQCCMRCMY